MNTIEISEETYQRLLAHSSETGSTIAELVEYFTAVALGESDALTELVRESEKLGLCDEMAQLNTEIAAVKAGVP